MNVLSLLKNNPVIFAARNDKMLMEVANNDRVDVIFLLKKATLVFLPINLEFI